MIYRNSFAKHFDGIDLAVTPFLTVVKGNQLKKLQLDELRPENNSLPIIPQIIGKNVDNFLILSQTLADIGVEEINWNLGCPHPTMTKKKQGSGLLPHPELIQYFLDQVFSRSLTRLSVKVRLGLKDSHALESLMPIFNQYPITELTIHPRLGIQMYKGNVDLQAFDQIQGLSEKTLVYNGDIYTKSDAENIFQNYPKIKKMMLGRGLFANPFLAAEIKGVSNLSEMEKRSKLKDFHDDLLNQYSRRLCGDAHLIMKMIGQWEYLSNFFENSTKLYKRIKKSKSMAKYQEIIADMFSQY